MKKILPFLCITVFACHDKTSTHATTTADSTVALTNDPIEKQSGIDGLWTGIFDSSAADKVLWHRANKFLDDRYNKINAGVEDELDNADGEIMNINTIPPDLRTAFYIEPLNGYYSLKGLNKISVIIDGINESGQVTGKSVCAGMERSLKGDCIKTSEGFKATLKEPGDNRDDGVFNLNFFTATGKVSGTWTSITGSVKSCSLEKREFQYDPQAGSIQSFRPKNRADEYLEFKKNPSADLLATKDLENLTKPELTVLRNLIYARRGYAFANSSFRNYFEMQEWYFPYKADIRNDLSDVEKKNLDKIKGYEKYASDAYDEFGR